MFNVEQLKQMAADAINCRTAIDSKRWILCIDNDKLACRPIQKGKVYKFVFWTFGEERFDEGFDGPEWNLIGKRLMNYWKEFKT